MVQARAAQPCPSASHQISPRFGWERSRHGPHSLCCFPIGCLSRFSANAGAFDGPGKLRARSTWRPNCCLFLPPNQVNASRTPRKQRSVAMVLSLRTSAQWCPGFDQRTALAAKRSFVFRFFKRLRTDTRLPALSWRPYSLRRGGATAHFLEHGSLDKTAVRGRWPSTKTARIYINEAVSTLAQITLTTLQQISIGKCAKIILQPDMLKRYFRGRSIPSPAAVEPGSCAVEAAGSGGCSSARSRRCATAAAHTCHVSASAGDHLIPRIRASGSRAFRPNLATRYFGCRAQKRNNVWNHSHIWNTDDGSK